MKFPIALQLYSIRDDLEKDFDGTIRKVKELGYDGVEFAGFYGNDPAKIRSLLDEVGLPAISAHVPYDQMKEDIDKVIEDYTAIGCKYIAIPYLVESDRPGTPGFAAVIENAKKFGAAMKEKGITLLYHNHDFEFLKVDGEYALDILYSEVPESLLETEIDTCWVNVAGENPSEYILKYTGRSPVVHLKDFYMTGKKPEKMYELIGIQDDGKDDEAAAFEFRPVGKGLQDFPKILEASEKAGAKWIVVEQDMPSMGLTAMECAKVSIDYLRSL